MLSQSRQRFNREVDFLRNYFPCLGKMEGIIVKLDTDGGFDNYQKEIGDPMEENTLIIADEDNNTLLFFNYSSKTYKTKILEGVTVITTFCYDKESQIHRKKSPIDVPSHLEKYIFDFALTNSFRDFTIKQPDEDFLERNYQKSGMILLKEMKKHPEWKEEYRNNIGIKRIQICKSCSKRWLKDCCSEYRRDNRTMLKMVIGWSKNLRYTLTYFDILLIFFFSQ